MNSIVPKIHDSEAAIAFESLKMYKERFIKESRKLSEQITANKKDLEQKQIDHENEEIKTTKINKEKNLIFEFESFVDSETKTLKSFINRIEQKTLNGIPNPTKSFYLNINNQIEKFIYEINKFPRDHEEYKNDAHSKSDKNENRVQILQQEINLLKNTIKSSEDNLRIIESKLSTLKDFKNNIISSMKESLENDRGGGYTELANKIHKFIIQLTNRNTVALTLCTKCHGIGQCLACDNTGYKTIKD